MKKGMLSLTALSLTGMLALPVPAPAHTNRPANPVDKIERHQQKRIQRGVRSGELTRQEARKLEKEQARIRAHEARAKADGTLTPQERHRLAHELERSNRHIYRETHDRQGR